ncbi:hypothetical protein PENTCL1PPCAC_14496, partial [Pristionchus entomophagus]
GYLSFITFEFGELINSFSFILTGAGRLQSLVEMHSPTTVHDCFYGRFWPHAQILGTDLPTLFLILTSIERICAVCWPSVFKELFSVRRQFAMIITCVALAGNCRELSHKKPRKDTKTNVLIAFTGEFFH